MITSSANPKVKNIILLRNKSKVRKENKLFLIEGIRMFAEVPEERVRDVFVTKEFLDRVTEKQDPMSKKVYQKLKARPFEIVSEEVFAKMADTVTPQGILCTVRFFHYEKSDIIKKESPFLLLLEDIQDPGNLGTMFRTAEGAGITGIVMSRKTADVYNPKVIRSTMGSVFRMPFYYAEDLTAFTGELTDSGISVYAAALDGASDYSKVDYSEKAAILIGNEGSGLSKEIVAASSQAVFIPMAGQVESLNASISAAILMYQAAAARRK